MKISLVHAQQKVKLYELFCSVSFFNKCFQQTLSAFNSIGMYLNIFNYKFNCVINSKVLIA